MAIASFSQQKKSKSNKLNTIGPAVAGLIVIGLKAYGVELSEETLLTLFGGFTTVMGALNVIVRQFTKEPLEAKK